MSKILRLARTLAFTTGIALAGLTLVTAAFYGWLQLDTRNVANSLEWSLSELLGRQLEIGELVEADLGVNSRLVANNVSLSNPAWASAPHLARASRVTLEINVPSLWRDGPVLVPHLELDHADIDLAIPPSGSPNWLFWPKREASPTQDNSPFPVIFTRGYVSDSTLRYRDDDQDITARIATLKFAEDEKDEQLQLEVEGSINEAPLTASGHAGPLRALFTGRQLGMDLQLKLGQLMLEVEGSAEDLQQLLGLDVSFSLNAPSSRPLLDMLGIPEVRDGPLAVSGTIKPDANGLKVDLEGQLEEFTMALHGSIGQALKLDDLALKFDFHGPSLREAGAMFKLDALPDIDYAGSGTLERRGKLLVLSDTTIRTAQSRLDLSGSLPEFPSIDDWELTLQGQQINLALLAPVLGLEEMPDQPYDLSGTLSSDDDGVELLDVLLTSGSSKMHLNGVVSQAPSHHGTRLHMEISGQNMAEMAPWFGLKKMPGQEFLLRGDLRLNEAGWHLSNGQLESPGLQIGMTGQMDRLRNTSKFKTHLDISAPDLAATLAAYGVQSEFGAGQGIEFSGLLSGTAEQINIAQGQIQFAENTVKLDGDLGNLRDLQRIRLNLNVTGEDLRPHLPYALAGPTPLPLEASGKLAFTEQSVHLTGVTGSIPGTTVSISGELKSGIRQTPNAIDGRVTISGQSSKELQYILGLDAMKLDDQAYRIESSISGSGNTYQLEPLQVTAGKSDLSGTVQIQLAEIPTIHTQLHSNYLHLPFLLPDLVALEEEVQPLPDNDTGAGIEEYSGQLSASEFKERIIPDTPLPLHMLRKVDGSLEYTAEEIFLREGVSALGSLALELKAGKLSASKLAWDGSFAKGRGLFTLDASSDNYPFQLSLEGERHPLLLLLAGEPDLDGESMYKARLSGEGHTLRKMASSLNGAIVFSGEGGRMNNRGFDLIMGDLMDEIFSLLNPTTQTSPYTKVTCSAGAFTLNDGVMEAIPGFILSTKKLDWLSAGSIDLNTEILDLAISTRLRKGLGISAGRALTRYVKLGGTLANPRLALDKKGAAVSGGAAVATAGWSIVAEGMWDRWVATSGDPCKRLIKQARKDPDRPYRSLLRGSKTPGDAS